MRGVRVQRDVVAGSGKPAIMRPSRAMPTPLFGTSSSQDEENAEEKPGWNNPLDSWRFGKGAGANGVPSTSGSRESLGSITQDFPDLVYIHSILQTHRVFVPASICTSRTLCPSCLP